MHVSPATWPITAQAERSGSTARTDSARSTFESCTFAGNGAADGTVFARDGVPITLTACIITGAYVIIGGPETWPGDAAVTWGTATITAADCDVWGNGENWTGPLADQDGHDGNFSANPCFCDATAGDFHLCADSWCAPEHNVAHPGVLVGTLPVGCEACDCDDGADGCARGGAVQRCGCSVSRRTRSIRRR